MIDKNLNEEKKKRVLVNQESDPMARNVAGCCLVMFGLMCDDRS